MKGGQTMIKAFLSVIGTLLGVLGVFADNISIADISIESGKKCMVEINLNNTENNLVSFQMDLTLPRCHSRQDQMLTEQPHQRFRSGTDRWKARGKYLSPDFHLLFSETYQGDKRQHHHALAESLGDGFFR